LQQRHATHVHSTHWQHAQAFFSTFSVFIALSWDHGGMPWNAGWGLTLLEGQPNAAC
jgi:hypothetical protein